MLGEVSRVNSVYVSEIIAGESRGQVTLQHACQINLSKTEKNKSCEETERALETNQ